MSSPSDSYILAALKAIQDSQVAGFQAVNERLDHQSERQERSIEATNVRMTKAESRIGALELSRAKVVGFLSAVGLFSGGIGGAIFKLLSS